MRSDAMSTSRTKDAAAAAAALHFVTTMSYVTMLIINPVRRDAAPCACIASELTNYSSV